MPVIVGFVGLDVANLVLRNELLDGQKVAHEAAVLVGQAELARLF